MRVSLSALVAIGLLVTAVSHAHADPDEAREVLKREHRAVMRLMEKPEGARSERLDRMVRELLDFQELSRRSLGEHWDERSSAERETFVELLRKLVQRSYTGNVERTLDYEVSYEAAEQEGDVVLVRTTARSKKNPRKPPISIDYRMAENENEWRVFDIITDGVSMVQNYREQFDKIIQEEGWDGLLSRMRSKLESKKNED